MIVRRTDLTIVDLTGNQKWHRLQIQTVDLERYSRQTGGIELLQAKIKEGTRIIKLVWTPRWLLSPGAIENI